MPLKNTGRSTMSEWVPLHVHSHYSLLDGLSKPTKIAERCVKLGYKSCAITDHGTIAGTVQFIKALKDCCKCGHQKGIHDAGKKCRIRGCPCGAFDKAGVKPILGSEFYLCPQDPTVKDKTNRKLSHLVVLAKNLDGWKGLIQATSAANSPDHIWYKKPRLNLEKLAGFAKGNFIAFSGHLGSDLADACFVDPRLAYKTKTYEEAKALVRPDWKEAVLGKARQYVELFGKENFYVEIQLIDHTNLPAAVVVARILRWIAKQLSIPCVATPDAHYPTKEDAPDQRILLCSQFNTTLSYVQRKIELDEDTTLGGFFKSNNYHIPSLEEIEALHEPDEIRNAVEIAEKCEVYDVLCKPILPSFKCPQDMDPNAYLKHLCVKGWKEKIVSNIAKDKIQVYGDRVKRELGVIFEAGLSSYFLVVQDYVNFAKDKGWLVGPGRGSGAGCLVSNLIGITSIDPIEYGLLFERFYNAGRNTKDRVSLPDIDSDFPQEHRDEVITYAAQKYGLDRVAQMITFGRMQGKSAMKDVLHAHEACTFDEMNRISEHIPADSEISDKLEEMRQATGESSIIRWALENNDQNLRKWCYINEKGELDGEYAIRFEQAIRMEGTKRNQGKHPSGIVMAPCPLAEVCPMVYDKSENQVIAGLEMNDLEAIGLVKFDILGVAVLDKIMGVVNILEHGEVTL
jgi:DNA polymerase-3 subunit alpha